MTFIHPIKGSAQVLKPFERTIKYISSDNVVVDDDGYVRGMRRIDEEFKAAVVPVGEETYNNLDYGDVKGGAVGVIIRMEDQSLDINIEPRDYFIIDDVEWKILRIDKYETVTICTCGRKKWGGYPVE